MIARASLLGRLAIVAAAAAWGTWILFLRAAEKCGPTHAAIESVVMMSVITVVSGGVALRERAPLPRSLAPWIGVVLLGVFDAVNVICFFRAYQTTSVAIAVLTHYLAPIFVTLGAPFILSEPFTRRGAIGCVVSFGGLVLLLQPWQTPLSSLTGAAYGTTSAACYAVNIFINKKFTPPGAAKRAASKFTAASLMAWHGVIATPLLALFVPSGAWQALPHNSLLFLLAGSLLLGAIAGLVFVWGLRRTPSNVAATLTFVEPLVAVLVGAVVYGEKMGMVGAAGGLLVLGGAYGAAVRQ